MIVQETTYDLLNELTDNVEVRNEILRYTKNKFLSGEGIDLSERVPFLDEAYVAVWRGYSTEIEKTSLFEVLKSHLVQFQFPIAKGISGTEEYRAAVFKGKDTRQMETATGLVLNKPEALQLKIHQSLAGKIPVLFVPDADDFVTIIRALSHKNEPKPIPASMGAALISGLNNWSRIKALKTAWLAQNPFGNWGKHFMQHILPNKSLYQDKLIVLSEKEYSGVQAADLGMGKTKWKQLSVQIRLEHECAHFFTLCYYGAMANNMHDELIADYMGIQKANGSFNPDWFLKCIGLEDYPKYRKGARLENYLGKPALSQEAFRVLRAILKRATTQVNEFDRKIHTAKEARKDLACLISLCSLSLLEIAGKHGAEKLYKTYKEQYQRIENL